jgi:hypothetical protein
LRRKRLGSVGPRTSWCAEVRFSADRGSAVRRADAHQHRGRKHEKPVEERAERDVGEVVAAIGDALHAHDQSEQERRADHRRAPGRRRQQRRRERPRGARRLAGDEGAVGRALPVETAERPELPFPTEILRLERPGAMRMLLDEAVDEESRSKRQSDRQKREIAAGRHQPSARVEPRADISEHEGGEDREGGKPQDCAQRSAKEGRAIERMVPLIEGMRHREIELGEREKHAGRDDCEHAAEDEGGGQKPNDHSRC